MATDKIDNTSGMINEPGVDIEPGVNTDTNVNVEDTGTEAVEIAKEITQEINKPTMYERGDFVMKCYKCQFEDTLQKSVAGGLRFDMYTTDQHKITLACKACGNKMELYFKESAIDEQLTETVEEITDNKDEKSVLEDSKE